MQYETIILELLTRVQKLEDDVTKLKQSNSVHAYVHSQGEHNASDEPLNELPSAYKKMTDEMIDICYKCGKKVHEGENPQELADEIANDTGMNHSSAVIYLYAVNSMIEGTVYKRAISAKAMQKYFNAIFEEYGSAGLKKAIKATKLHIDYRRKCGHQVDSIEEICKKYESKR